MNGNLMKVDEKEVELLKGEEQPKKRMVNVYF
jgi:hypothetical protein